MRNTNKKGFTIVELVIVVAVIAILAAVMIPTFSGIIDRAKLSADKKAVHELNTYVAMEEANDFAKALAALEKHNVNTENLAPISAGYSFSWNDTEKKFDLVETKDDTVAIADAIKEIEITVSTDDYLVYAVNNGSKNIKLGADVTYPEFSLTVNSGDVTIDLNGHTLTLPEFNNGKVDRHNYVEVKAGATLTLVGGTVKARGVQAYADAELIIKGTKVVALDTDGGAAVYAWAGSKITVESGEFVASEQAECVINAGGEVVINGGTFTHTLNNTELRPYTIETSKGGTTIINNATVTGTRGIFACIGNNSVTTINAGTFKTEGANGGWCVYTDRDSNPASTAKVTINGGTFEGPMMFYGNVEDKR